ncbi:MAG: DsbA family protein [Longimicrobiales bacterium]
MDFECPFCAKWAARVDSLLEEYPRHVRLVVHHLPLSIHSIHMPCLLPWLWSV